MERAFELTNATGTVYPRRAELLPTGTLESGRWRARFARRPSELDDVLRLRYEVFNVELGEGLETSHATQRDEDRFDAHCHHLLVEEKASGAVVGTYRMQTCEMARNGCGFYSAGEYDLTQVPSAILDDSIEVGRACIHRDHRHKLVLFLLWQGLAAYVQATRKRYLFGCSSVQSQEPAEGLRLFHQLSAAGDVHESVAVPALPSLRCAPNGSSIQDAGGAPEDAAPFLLPTLFRTYLRYGAKVVSEPALDREFKTIDFLLLLDVAGLSPRSRQVFFGGRDPLGGSHESDEPAGC